MKVLIGFAVSSTMLFSSLSAMANDKKVLAVIDEWCPYNCQMEAKNTGYIVDIMRTVFEKNGYQFEYRDVSWTRSIDMVSKGKADVTFGLGYYGVFDEELIDGPEDITGKQAMKLVKKSGLAIKMAHGKQQYYSLKKDKKLWNEKDTLENNLAKYKLGVQQDYDYGEEVMKFISKNPKKVTTIGGKDPLARLIKLTKKGRVNLVAEDKNVFEYKSSELGVKNLFKVEATSADEYKGDSDLIAFFSGKNPKKSKKLVKLLDKGIKEMRKSGELKKILDKYGLQDWE